LPLFQVVVNRPPNQLADRGSSLFGQLGQGLELMIVEIDVPTFHLQVYLYTLKETAVNGAANGSKLVANC
jgi:hypothetical protein